MFFLSPTPPPTTTSHAPSLFTLNPQNINININIVSDISMVRLLSMELQEDKRMCKAEFDFPGMTVDYNNNNHHSAYDEDWDILNVLDLPMESLEEDGFAEDWDAKLGPIPSEVLRELEYPVLSNKTSQQQCHHHQASFRAPSPNSVLESRSSSLNNKGVSFGVELSIPVRTRTKRLRPSVNPWLMSGFIVLPNKDKKRKKPFQNVEKENVVGNKKCAHCGTTKTPQWRGGPMGPKTLCNACGVRYRSGRLFPEYRPAASPTFVPALHSNSHRKVIEMRQNAVK